MRCLSEQQTIRHPAIRACRALPACQQPSRLPTPPYVVNDGLSTCFLESMPWARPSCNSDGTCECKLRALAHHGTFRYLPGWARTPIECLVPPSKPSFRFSPTATIWEGQIRRLSCSLHHLVPQPRNSTRARQAGACWVVQPGTLEPRAGFRDDSRDAKRQGRRCLLCILLSSLFFCSFFWGHHSPTGCNSRLAPRLSATLQSQEYHQQPKTKSAAPEGLTDRRQG
ncbi:hypothetical protein EV126DRAFT_166948 [Verticillium dahliae]|nr:hypothetical protein EV126DRAFT_166948 [Verticillium dahliae]